MKKIVLINQVSGYLFIDIANAFCQKYDEVVLISGRIAPMGQELNPNIKIINIKGYNKKTKVTRLISWITAFFQIFVLLLFRYKKHDLFISSNPPLGTLIPLFLSNKSSLLIYDIYPDGLVAAKLFHANNLIIRSWRKLNILSYKKTDHIITLTNGMADLLSQYINRSKITVISAWSSKAFDKKNNFSSQNIFITKHGLKNKFLVVFSGNLGMGYEIESLVYVADLLKENDKIKFLIMGDGWKKEQLESLIFKLNLTNCILLPQQPTEMFMAVLNTMNLGVVSLGKIASKIAIPSKTYNILANGKPILCIGDKDSDLALMIEEHGIGATFLSDEINEIAEYIKLLSSENNAFYTNTCERASMTSNLFTSLNADKIVELVSMKN